MAHDRIFQLSTEPVTEDETLSESDLYESEFLVTSASYVYNVDEKRNEDIAEFVASLNEKFIEKTESYIVFKQGFRQDYFAKQFNQFKTIAEAMTIEDFTDGGAALYRLEQAIEIKFSTVIFIEYCQSLCAFVRELEEGVPYYFGGVVGYHF